MWRKGWIGSFAVGIVLVGMLGVRVWMGQAGADEVETFLPEQIPAAASYRADVQVEMKTHTVRGTVAVRFAPQDDKAYFHLYPNAFQAKADLSGENWEQVLGKQREPGNIQITEVRVDGKRVPVLLKGELETLLEVPLAGKSAAQQTEVELRFALQVPYNNGRLSYNDHAMWLGNWLPILAVKGDGGWRLDPYAAIGDPFYSEMANYRLRVQLEEGYQLASSGIESIAVVTQTRPQRQTIYELDAWNVRDFALVVMDDTYRQLTGKVGDVTVRTWSQEGDDPASVDHLHQVAMKSLNYYGEQFGRYPYQEYDVVKTGGFFGGMEYPSIVFIQDEYFGRTDPVADAIVAHETAHQWFYALVGNDEVREAWMDESLTDYATMAFLYSSDPNRARGYIQLRLSQSKAAERYAAQGLNAWQSLLQFPTWKSYTDLVYGRGAAMWWTLRESWGEKQLHHLLRQYVHDNQYAQADGQEIIKLLSQAAGADATPFIDYWLRLKLDERGAAEAWVEKGKHE
ncbi:M1 family metallopeptidase [Brevibacillus choshinensis]|uniref:M1 family metallopeptidase n=1 Tax=Brevibacillus choshinensis TaxID=54911 RepID=A0ABX7FQW2_BRECH|nr:M1 family metallopeptidase [Brevibacillus choshinensis]QRG68190.1 M1 family metallopeptidase [Brevibacillus choshinensis]